MKTAETTRTPALLDRRRLVMGLSGAAVAVASTAASAKPERDEHTAAGASYPVTYHRTATVDGIKIFYREAGPKDAPVVLLLHGFPTSSHMYRNLIPALADRYHVIAPDYPGFGHSERPPVGEFGYTFDSLADHVDALLDHLGLTRYALYVQDYGAPVGWRLALRHPERIAAIVTQNGNAYVEGFVGDAMEPLFVYGRDRSEANADVLRGLI